MSKSPPKSVKEKLEIIQLYLTHEYSISQLVTLYQVSESTIKRWINRYEKNGMTGLRESQTWKSYSKEVKEQAVQDYLDGAGSQSDIWQKYAISSPSVLQKWIKRYTSGKALNSTSKGHSHMNKGRKTTFEERLRLPTSRSPMRKITTQLLKSLESPTNRFIHGYGSLKRKDHRDSLINVERD